MHRFERIIEKCVLQAEGSTNNVIILDRHKATAQLLWREQK